MLDYALFRSILEELSEVYPRGLHPNDLVCMKTLSVIEKGKPLAYLCEHRLITMGLQYRGKQPVYGKATITMRGIDFLQPDGGLSALNAPTIRIAPESLIAMIDASLAARNVPAEERGIISEALGVAKTEGLSIVLNRLIDAGLTCWQDIFKGFTQS